MCTRSIEQLLSPLLIHKSYKLLGNDNKMDNISRKQVIDDIMVFLKENEKKTDTDLARIMIYEFRLPLCTLYAHIAEGVEKSIPAIDIAENFGESNVVSFSLRNKAYLVFDGVRRLYKGSYDGLDEIALQGINRPKENGLADLEAERLIRSKEFGNLKEEDVKLFDSWLMYIHNQIR